MFNMIKKIFQHGLVTLKYPREPLDTTNISGKPEISALCTGCGECINRCPSSAMVKNPDRNKAEINLDECIFCYLCAQVCPISAVHVTGDFELAQKNRSALRSAASPLAKESLEITGQKLEARIKKLLGRSLQIREVDAGSSNGCDYEINALNNPFNDLERFGIHFVASPRHADMLLVTGPAVRNMEAALKRTYEATPDPKLVVAVGACACSGGIFKDNYATRDGIDTVIPVDMYVPGCPPRPQAILYGILKALDRIDR